MAFKNILDKVFGRQSGSQFALDYETNEINFVVSPEQLRQIKNNQADEWIAAQYVALKMLQEQGEVESFPSGFIMPTQTAVRLDESSRQLLVLPEPWQGSLKANIKGQSNQSTFDVDLSVNNQDGRYSSLYNTTGAIIEFGQKQYLLTVEQFNVFSAQRAHKNSAKTEFDNLSYLHVLQQSQQNGCELTLGHFNKLKIRMPQSISVEAEVDKGGNLILTPYMGQDASHESIQKVLWQLQPGSHNTATTLKVGDEIILFDEEKLKAVKEILSNRVVPKHRVKAFLANPTAFIDATLVDLDLGFSVRVHGATAFKHAYFGDIEASGIDWLGQSSSESVLPITRLNEQIADLAAFEQFSDKFEDAQQTNATVMDFEGQSYDISDSEQVANVLRGLQETLTDPLAEPLAEDDDVAEQSPQTHVVDVDLNDDELSDWSPVINKQITEIAFKGPLDWHNYARQPFSHQEVGIRWILGLADKTDKRNIINGGLLADDMGLGKTYMALSAIEHLYRQASQRQQVKKPALIVAPLSLLENWKDEVDKTFKTSPFNDIVILQSDVDLKRYKEGAVEIRNQSVSDGCEGNGREGDKESKEDEFTPRYSLKVGKLFGPERLDMPGRLVIITYQTMRDYQFSLCLIDWGVVVFDEAQNIKNPNALQTRAAKGLKADLKLVTTGTPVENSLADFWCLMDTACPGYLGSYQDFRASYITPILAAEGDDVHQVREQAGRELRLEVGALMLRRLKEDNLNGLPQKHIHVGIEDSHWRFMPTLSAVMSGEQQRVYDGTIEAHSADDPFLPTLTQLRYTSLHPGLANGGQLEIPNSDKALNAMMAQSAKVQSLLVVLDEIKAKGEKCIIFALNKRLQSFLSLSLGKRYSLGPLSVINGDAKATAKGSSVPTRKSMIADFEARAGFNLIVMSPVAAGVGLTVIGANHVVHFERHWNPAKEAQASDRVYRIGQTKDVHIYIPVLHHPEFESFDVNLHRLLTKKTLLKDAVVTPEEVQPQSLGACLGGQFNHQAQQKAKEE